MGHSVNLSPATASPDKGAYVCHNIHNTRGVFLPYIL
nr:MAG TPA: hypothetical protein [Bacteriophage sp.]